MDVTIPKALYTPEDPRRFYRAMSNEIVSRIMLPSFSVLELSPGSNANPMNFLASAAGKRLSSYTCVEPVPGNCRVLESNRISRNLHILNKDPMEELDAVSSWKSYYNLLLLSGLQKGPVPAILKKVEGRVQFIAIYADNERLQPSGNRLDSLQSALTGYDVASFSFPGRSPSLFFASAR